MPWEPMTLSAIDAHDERAHLRELRSVCRQTREHIDDQIDESATGEIPSALADLRRALWLAGFDSIHQPTTEEIVAADFR
jgi:hypothetical protein